VVVVHENLRQATPAHLGKPLLLSMGEYQGRNVGREVGNTANARRVWRIKVDKICLALSLDPWIGSSDRVAARS
jgi:hypothetical protein